MENLQKTSVRYENARWTAQSGQDAFIAKDKNTALLWALKRDRPEIYEHVFSMLCDHAIDGQIAFAPKNAQDRILKGAQLVCKNHIIVEGYKLGRESAKVLSQNDKGTIYNVSRSGDVPNEWRCTCEDFRMHRFFSPVYGHMCKHSFAVLLFLAQYPQPRQKATFEPDKDPDAYKALTDGYEFEYYYGKALEFYGNEIFLNAQNTLLTADVARTIAEIRTCSGATFPHIFEIPELNGEQFGRLWDELYDLSRNGDLPTLKTQLIDTINNL